MGNKRVIYVAGYPRSGTTWLTRLLGSALDCPTGAVTPGYDKVEPATEGLERSGGCVVRKGHLDLTDDEPGTPIPDPHLLAYKELKDEGVVWITRDPRDVAVSIHHYWNRPLRQVVEGMTGHCNDGPGNWVKHTQEWLGARFCHACTRYEDLLDDTEGELRKIVWGLNIYPCANLTRRAVSKQRLAVRQRHAYIYGDQLPLGKAYHIRTLRKGVVGDWQNYFGPEMEELAWKGFGETMTRLGYER